jgi:hypothetical protein
LPDLAQCEFWLFCIWELIWRAIDFQHSWHQEEQGKKCEQCKWELSVLLRKKTAFKVTRTISM